MKSTKLMLGTMILGLGVAGAAWAQPAPSHDRDAAVHSGYAADRYYVNRARGDQDAYQRGDGDHDRDDRNVWNVRGDRDDRNRWRGDHDARSSWNWGHNDVRRGKKDDR